jgi:hypothetical protein
VRTKPARAWGENRSIITDTAALRTLHRAEDIGSALKGGVNFCQRQLVNEVLGPLVTEFVCNFGREDPTAYQRGQRGSNASLLGRVQSNSSDIMRSDISEPPPAQRGATGLVSARWPLVKPAETGVEKYPLISAAQLN